jgi:uncharacterized protein YkwD
MRWVVFALSSLLLVVSSAKAQPPATGAQIVREMNLARQHPQVYATYMEELRAAFQGKIFRPRGKSALQTKEGVAGLEDALRFLRHVRPLGPLEFSVGLSIAARDHVIDQSAGGFGHRGSDRSNPAERIRRHGAWSGNCGENICYGRSSAREIVLTLIIDDGLRSRKHRKNIFSQAFNFAGAAVGFHPQYGTLCSIDFAGGYSERNPGGSDSLAAGN